MQKKQKHNQIKQKQENNQRNRRTQNRNQTIRIQTKESTKPKNKTKAVCQLKNKARKQNKLIKVIKKTK